jgi:endonuclease-3
MATKKATTKQTPRARKPNAAVRDRAAAVLAELRRLYPDAHCALDFQSPFELLVATILSAQCTDVRVNMVTPALFKRYPTPTKMAAAEQGDIETLIRSTGFFRNKAKSIKGAATRIAEQHDSEVPATMDELLQLPGVARKTANVVLGNAFGINVGMVVDTHIGRLSKRLGFTKSENPIIVERDLMALFPQETWCQLAHLLIYHGRQVCAARKPACERCTLAEVCPKVGVAGKK